MNRRATRGGSEILGRELRVGAYGYIGKGGDESVFVRAG